MFLLACILQYSKIFIVRGELYLYIFNDMIPSYQLFLQSNQPRLV